MYEVYDVSFSAICDLVDKNVTARLKRNGMRYEENRFEDGKLNSIYLYCDDKFIGSLTAYKGRVELKYYIKTENYEYRRYYQKR